MLIARRIETITVATVTLVAIAISLLDLAGLLDGIVWLRTRIPVLALLAIGALAAHLVIEQSLTERNQSNLVSEAVNQAMASLMLHRVEQSGTSRKRTSDLTSWQNSKRQA